MTGFGAMMCIQNSRLREDGARALKHTEKAVGSCRSGPLQGLGRPTASVRASAGFAETTYISSHQQGDAPQRCWAEGVAQRRRVEL